MAQLLGEWRPDEAMEVVMVVEFVMLARLAAVAGEGAVMVVVVASPGELLMAVSVVEVMVVLGEVVVAPKAWLSLVGVSGVAVIRQ